MANRSMKTGLFLAATALTTLTGFFFPFHGLTPAIVVGVISLIPISLAVYSPIRAAWMACGGDVT